MSRSTPTRWIRLRWRCNHDDERRGLSVLRARTDTDQEEGRTMTIKQEIIELR
jgi:hypothetical protein